ncbi:LOW QUALITY PROTEIN: voltage-dependent T-type calcium channel subunit alpha-1H-like [Pollicipes pollicipes]|uniref:LOW QUALITY PROTEIN: voltage-dependent T-type calcium channel subunit alpha-1H-like n=1 Tax=Pollicipes pollicipes TaxID=41117 RepID=UPI00188507B4|nr:LOW QUALITY PROTEIN: voltage-dependent T-type calcium channel subunit alpha-1H-like [Pollicipes pollicipes]
MERGSCTPSYSSSCSSEETLTGSEEDDLPFPGFAPVTFRRLEQTHPLRHICLRMITNPWFERVTMLVIFINCVTLGMYQPCEDAKCASSRCRLLEVGDDIIYAYFLVEMLIKMVAMGVYGERTYLAESWNRLDFFIVAAGLIEYCLNVENMDLSAIRTIRVLRPLRAINRIPSMRILVMLLLDTLPMLGNVLLLCFFVFFIFGIVGVQLWAGILRQRCFLQLPPNVSYAGSISSYYRTNEQEKDYICSLGKDNGLHTCDNLPPTKIEGRECGTPARQHNPNVPTNGSCVNWNQYYTECRAGDKNPFQGAMSFDNIGLAWVAIFLVISLEGWTDIMYYIQDAHSFWDFIYFVLLIVIGSFFMINLCLVVIATQFSETKKRETERMRLERARFQSTSTLGSSLENAGCYAEILRYIAHVWRRLRRRLRWRWRRWRRKPPTRFSLRRRRGGAPGNNNDYCDSKDEWAPRASPEASDVDPLSTPRHPELRRLRSSVFPRVSQSADRGPLTCTELLAISGALSAALPRGRGGIKRFIEHSYCQKGILLAIMINTLSMGVEFHNQPEWLTSVVEISNIIFSAIFALEMLLKLIAVGFYGYISNGFNVFDGLIVIISAMDLYKSQFSETGEGGSSLSVLRTFRLLRILKLVRFLPNLRRQLLVMLKTMDNVAIFFSLLILFIFIFSILGMNLFGCRFCRKDAAGQVTCDRKNFDSLLWACITVFQILTQEDWNVVLFNGMERTSPWAALYFVALMTFGNYVLFNLLVAILVEGFSSERHERAERQERERLRALRRQGRRRRRSHLSHLSSGSGPERAADPELGCSLSLECRGDRRRMADVSCLSAPPEILMPPIITRTAATPQSSPHATLESRHSHRHVQLTQTPTPAQVISLEGWTDIMYYIQDAHSFWDFIYFVLLIVIGSFFMINLCLVVIATQFSETKKRETERMRLERARFQSTSTLGSSLENAGCYAEILRYIAHVWRRLRRRLRWRWRRWRRKPPTRFSLRRRRGGAPGNNNDYCDSKDEWAPRASPEASDVDPLSTEASWSGASESDWSSDESDWSEAPPRPPPCPRLREAVRRGRGGIKRFIEHSYCQKGILLAIMINTLSMGVEFHNQPEWLTSVVEISNIIFSAIFALEMLLKLIAVGFYGYISNGFNVFDGLIVIISAMDLYKSQFSETGEGGSSLSVLRTFRLLRILKLVRFLPNLRRQLLVMLKTMDNVAIFFSLLILFIFIFSILGMNLFGCRFCRKDAAGQVTCDRKNFDSLLWACITVFQFCMRRDGSGACLCGRLADHDPLCACQRKNFDNFLWATVTVFQVKATAAAILTQEDWNVVLFNGMERTSPWAALYFVALMTFGNYVLFNLLVAILVEGFSSERHERAERQERERLRALRRQGRRRRRSHLSHLSSGSGPERAADPELGCSLSLECRGDRRRMAGGLRHWGRAGLRPGLASMSVGRGCCQMA